MMQVSWDKVEEGSSFKFPNSLFIQRLVWTFWRLLKAVTAITILMRKQINVVSQYIRFLSNTAFFLLEDPSAILLFQPGSRTAAEKLYDFIAEYMVKCPSSLTVLMYWWLLGMSYSKQLHCFLHHLITNSSECAKCRQIWLRNFRLWVAQAGNTRNR